MKKFLALVLMVFLICPITRGQVTARWIGGSGNWSNSALWDIQRVPNNTPEETFSVIIELPDADAVVTVDQNIQVSGLINSESIRVVSGGDLTLRGEVRNTGDLAAVQGALRMFEVTAENSSHEIKAEGGLLEIRNSAIHGGNLRVTDNAQSLVRFGGQITLDGTAWIDDGAGEFQIFNTVAQFMGDYAEGLPAGYALVVWSRNTHSAVQWTLAGGVFNNDGMIELRHGGGGWVGYPRLHWEGSGVLAGSGEVFLSGAGDNNLITGAEGVEVTIGPDQWLHGRGEIQTGVTNQGTLEADLPERVLQIGGRLVNEGIAAVTNGGVLAVSGPVNNTGLLRSDEISGGGFRFAGGLSNSGEIDTAGAGLYELSGPIDPGMDLAASTGQTLRLSNAVVDNTGHEIVADGGIVEIRESIIDQGSLRVTDNAQSRIRFAGAVTLNEVPWVDEGAGEFQIFNSVTRFLGDYADGLPSGYTLVVWSQNTHSAVQWTLAGGVFTNDGMIELRHGGGGWVGYPRLHWEASGVLAGSGEVFLSGAGDNNLITGAEGVEMTIGPDQWLHGRGEIQTGVLNQGILEADRPGKTLVLAQPVENSGVMAIVADGSLHVQTGMTNTGTVETGGNGVLTLSGNISSTSGLSAVGGSRLRVVDAIAAMEGNEIAADGGVVAIVNSTLRNGTLRVGDDPTGQVRFAGEVTMNSVPWVDEGAGEFQIFNTTTRFLGDYAESLPAGSILVVWSQNTHDVVQWTMPGGVFTNDGLIELRHSGRGWLGYPRLYWEASGTLSGTGEVFLSGAGDNNLITGAAAVELTIGPDQWVHGRGEIRVDVINQGTLEADLPGEAMQLYGGVRNEGRLAALGSTTLRIAKDLENQGTLYAIDGDLRVMGSLFGGARSTIQTEGSGALHLGRHFFGNVMEAPNALRTLHLVLDGEGIAVPELAESAFFIEAEDFNFDRGVHAAEADIMPYLGGAYDRRAGRDRIDYHQNDNRTASNLYRINEGPGLNVNIYTHGDFDRGSFNVRTNYIVGFNDPGEWYNYTRFFPSPAPVYHLFARMSSGGLPMAIQIDEVVGATDTTRQTLSQIGEARGPATGDWGRYTFVPVRDEAGELVRLGWVEEHTLRASILEGGNENMDYFVLAPAFTSGPAQLLEAMSPDLGADPAGFEDAFALDSLTLQGASRVQIIDQADNASGASPEVLYANNLIIPASAILDLAGTKVYVQNLQAAPGSIVNGEVQGIPVRILTQPIDQELAVDSNLELSVEVAGTEPISFRWRKNGVNLDAPGAETSRLVISGLQPADSGQYSVVVSNPYGTQVSVPATVSLQLPTWPFADDFDNRGDIEGTQKSGVGTNLDATKEFLEPNHSDNGGGSSVWLKWTAPSTGILTLDTAGSAFDTLLAVYEGPSIDLLRLRAEDDDSGGYFASRVVLNVMEGMEYSFVVDGFGGATGKVSLNLDLEASDLVLPVIEQQPEYQIIEPGESATFEVGATGEDLMYQWYLDSEMLAGETGSTLIVDAPQAGDVGVYTVRVTNASGLSVTSAPAVLEIASVEGAKSANKFLDVYNGGSQVALAGYGPLIRPAGFVSVAMGSVGSQLFDNFGATTEAGEPAHGGIIGGASKWYGIQPVSDGQLNLSTEGSDVPTVLAVYTGNSLANLTLIAQDNSVAELGFSHAAFAVTRNTRYLVAVDTIDGVTGTIALNWHLDPPENPQSLVLGSPEIVDGTRIRFFLSGPQDELISIEASADLLEWTEVHSQSLTGDPVEFTDVAISSAPHRFYRAVWRNGL